MKYILLLSIIFLSGCSTKYGEALKTTEFIDSVPEVKNIDAPIEVSADSSKDIVIDVDSLCQEWYKYNLHDTVFVSEAPKHGRQITGTATLKKALNSTKTILTFRSNEAAYQDTIHNLRVEYMKPVKTITNTITKIVPLPFYKEKCFIPLIVLLLIVLVMIYELIKKKA